MVSKRDVERAKKRHEFARIYTYLRTVDTPQLDKIVSRFFKERFKRNPNDDPAYFGEWMDRFRTGDPIRFMDPDTERVWNKQKNKLRKVI